MTEVSAVRAVSSSFSETRAASRAIHDAISAVRACRDSRAALRPELAGQLAVSLERHRELAPALTDYSRARRAHLAWYQLTSRWLTPGFQSDHDWIAPLRDVVMPLLCRFPPSRQLMLASMAGVSRGPLRASMAVTAYHGAVRRSSRC